MQPAGATQSRLLALCPRRATGGALHRLPCGLPLPLGSSLGIVAVVSRLFRAFGVFRGWLFRCEAGFCPHAGRGPCGRQCPHTPAT